MSRNGLIARALVHPARVGHPITELLIKARVAQLPQRQRGGCWCSVAFDVLSASSADLLLLLDALSIFALDDVLGPANVGRAASVSLSVSASSASLVVGARCIADMQLAIVDRSAFIINMLLLDAEAECVLGSAQHIVWRLPRHQQQQQQHQKCPPAAAVAHASPRLVLSDHAPSGPSESTCSMRVVANGDGAAGATAAEVIPLLNLRRTVYGGAIAAIAARECLRAFTTAPLDVVSVAARYHKPVPAGRDVAVRVVASKNSGSVRMFTVEFSTPGTTLAVVDVTARVLATKATARSKL
jgi:hypothetical protein